jgi:hypothetical protein
MQEAVRLYRSAASCFGAVGAHQGGRLVLSLFFKAVLGVQHIFHFDSLTDEGFALLTGGRRCLSRRTLGGLVRAVSTRAVGKFVQLTRPVVSAAERLHVSIDEHVVARFTRKFLIPKGFHTIRDKKMRAEKLFFSFDTATRTLLDLVVTPGNGRLAPVASKMLGALRARCRDGLLRAVLDAGAAQSHRELLEVADHNPNQVLLVRVPRRKAYLDRWKALPEERFTAYDEPGRYKGAPPSASTSRRRLPLSGRQRASPCGRCAPSSCASRSDGARTGGMRSSSSATTPPTPSPSSRSIAPANAMSRHTESSCTMPSSTPCPPATPSTAATRTGPAFARMP